LNPTWNTLILRYPNSWVLIRRNHFGRIKHRNLPPPKGFLVKPVLLALDVSGSMAGSMIPGSCITAREGSAAMALITAATELECEIIAFSAPARGMRVARSAAATFRMPFPTKNKHLNRGGDAFHRVSY
jgi:hypothetical protein